ENAQSAIMVGDLYSTRADNVDSALKPSEGRIARYARGKDYHKVMKKRLIALADELRVMFPDDDFRVFVDTAPVLERELAQRAGLGWTGKHTLTIHPKGGSYFLLGGILSTRRFATPVEQEPITDHCGSCTRCIDACPTDAITPYAVDARRCISYLTIELRTEIDAEFHSAIGDWVYGCDICQEVCPHNSARTIEQLGPNAGTIHEAYTPMRDRFDLLEILGWTEDDRREAFKGSALKRAKLDMMQRNARIVLKNQSEV
ncbi:MAG: tRNA epoxyqueuosine(34) reductase QueG, partial [Phycisphaerales bacterium]|nr:tRNA epoxyqueuosine(34) reductase QueG [Phycisphaerales bacterium]